MEIRKIRNLAALCLIAIALVISSCGKQEKKSIDENALSGTINISGAFALYPMTVAWADSFMKLNPDVRINISAGGAGKGMTDALTGLVDIGMFSRGISDEEKAKGAFHVAVTRDAVLPVVSANNPVLKQLLEQGLKKQDFINIFLDNKTETWGELCKVNNNNKVIVYTRSDACGAAEMWGKYLGKDQESLIGTGVFGDPGIAEAVKKDINGIGYNNVIYVYDSKTRKPYQGLEIIPLDLNENGKIDSDENFYQSMDSIMKAITLNKYPSPPARDLYFITNGKPSNQLVIEFIKWILTSGQAMVEQAGYVNLTQKQIDAELTKLQ